MILQTFALMTALGLSVFALGLVFDRPDMAFVGAIFILGVGAIAVQSGVVVAVGSTTSTIETVEAVPDISEGTFLQEQNTQDEVQSPTGASFLLGGDVLLATGSSNDEVVRYNTSGYDITTMSFDDRTLDVSGEVDEPGGVDGYNESVAVADTAGGTIETWSTTDYDLSSASHEESLDVSDYAEEPTDVAYADDWLYVIDEDDETVHRYDTNGESDLSNATHEDSVDLSSQTARPTGVLVSNGGERLLVADDDDTVYQYELSSDYDVSTASYTGNALDVGDDVNELGGMTGAENGESITLVDYNQDNLVQYDTSTTATRDEETIDYEPVDSIAPFPLEVLVVMLGAFMAFVAAGRMSEADLE